MMLVATLFCLFAIASARWHTLPHQSDVVSDPELLPTESPVPPPTFTPTISPTRNPTLTHVATHNPVAGTPSAGQRCEINNGIFGAVGSSQSVTFMYEVETAKGTSGSVDSIIANLEVAMAEYILPSLFGSACPSVRRLAGRRLAATGVSTLPIDEVVSDLACNIKLQNEGDPCFVVDGIFTVYTNGTDVNSEKLVSVLTKAASEGEFDDVHPDVVKVTIVTVTPGGIEENSPTSSPASRSSQLGLGMYLGVAAGVLVVIGAAIFYRRRRNQSQVDADSTIMTPQVGGEVAPDNAQEPSYDLASINQ